MVTSGIASMFRIPELRKRLLFTLAILGVYRLGIFLTPPGGGRGRVRGVRGRRRHTQYTPHGTILLSGIQGFAIANYLESLRDPTGLMVVTDPGWGFQALTVISLTAGTAFIT